MGNREDLLAGARKVIIEQGVAKTTARDIAAAAGVSLAAIGYHFGSKEQLITEALSDALGTAIGDNMEKLIRAGEGGSLFDSFSRMWSAMPSVFETNRDSMLASMENLVRVAREPHSRNHYAQGLAGVYEELATALRAAHPELDEWQATAVAQLYFILVQGLGVMWAIAPDGDLPDGDQLAAAALAITAGVPPMD